GAPGTAQLREGGGVVEVAELGGRAFGASGVAGEGVVDVDLEAGIGDIVFEPGGHIGVELLLRPGCSGCGRFDHRMAPGLRMPCGSSASLMRAVSAITSGPS